MSRNVRRRRVIKFLTAVQDRLLNYFLNHQIRRQGNREQSYTRIIFFFKIKYERFPTLGSQIYSHAFCSITLGCCIFFNILLSVRYHPQQLKDTRLTFFIICAI